jgi:hypothetical protein
MDNTAVERLRGELTASAPNDWPRVLRTLRSRHIAAELLAALDRPPASHTRLGWELRLRVHDWLAGKEAA